MFRYALAALAAIVLIAASLVPDDAFARRGGERARQLRCRLGHREQGDTGYG